MLKTVLIVLAISWSQTEVNAQNELVFDPPAMTKDDTEVTITFKYDLSGGTADRLQYSDPDASLMFVWTQSSGIQNSVASVSVADDHLSDINSRHSLKVTGDWCSILGTYEASVTPAGGATSITKTGPLAADNSAEAIHVDVDGKPLKLNENSVVSTLTGKVTCVAYWTSNNVAVDLREGTNPDTPGAVGDSTPADCTKKAVSEINIDFTGAEDQTKEITCRVDFEGQQAVFTSTLSYDPNHEEPTTTAKATDGNGDGGDGTGDGNKDGDGTGDGNGDGTGDGNKDGDGTGDGTGDGDNDGGYDDKGDGKKDPLNKLFDKLREKNGACGIHTEVPTMILLLSAFWMLLKMF